MMHQKSDCNAKRKSNNMKKQSRNNRGLGVWVLGGVASAMMCLSALGQYVAVQATGITINDNGTGAPYPSTIDLTKSNILGSIEKITVSLNNVKHGYANDVGVLLVAPDGSKVVLMRNAGGGQPINGATLSFDDAGSSLSQFTAVSSGTYAPDDFDPNTSFLGSAPVGPYGAALSGMTGSTANGKWSLYVEDDSPLNAGSIDSWTLNLFTTPVLTLATNYVNLDENSSSGNLGFTLQDSSVPAGYTVTFGGPATNNFVAASGSVSGLNGTLTLTPKLNAFGTNTLTIFVNDGLATVQSDATVAIKHLNQPPTITLTNASVTTLAGVVSPVINAVVADVDPDDASSSLSISVSSSNTNLINPAGVFFDPANSGGLRTFTVVPAGIATGTATLTFTVKDAGNLTGTATLPVTVSPVSNPVFANTNLLGLSVAGTTNSSITVANISGAIGNARVAVSGLKTIAGNNLSLALIPPGGSPITLLQDAGSAGPNTFAQLSFSAGTGGSTLPASDTITSVPIQAAGLSALVNKTANGSWALWATNGGTVGQVVGGWSLSLQVAPTIATTITNISMPEEFTTNISFTIADIDGAITNASDVTVVSADPTLVKVSGVTFDTSTGVGSATLSSILGGPQFGKTTVTVAAKDNNNFPVNFDYNVTVTFVNHAPTMSFIVKQVTRAGTTLGPVPFTVGDIDLTVPLQTLTVSAVSSDQKILPNSNILLQGTGNNRTFTFFPVGTFNGDVQVTFTVSDGITSTPQTFTLAVQPQGNPLFMNLASISVPANDVSAPYPSTIAVSNLLGTISKVEVTLFDITHSGPDNLNMLLVSPAGKKVLLMGHAGGANALANTTIGFSDTAATQLPDSSQITSGTYQPSSFGTVASFPSVPAGATDLTLAAFNGLNGTNANGLWSLYVVDDGLGKGVIVNGWQLSIQTDPFVSPIADVTLKENDKTLQIPISLGDDQPGVNISASAVSGNPGVVTAVFEPGSGGNRILDITPVPYQIGSNILVTVTAQSGSAASSTNFHVTIYGVNLPPVLSSVGNINTLATTVSSVTTVTAWDPQDKALTITASSSDTKLIPNENITVTGPTTVGTINSHNILQYGVSVRSADADVAGTATITLLVTDAVGQSSTATFSASIIKGLVFLSGDGPISIPEGAPIASKATPYPSVIAVSNLDGQVTGAKVTLLGFSHSFPQDVDVLLVPPGNSPAIILMAHVGGASPVSNLRLNFDDAGTALTGSALTSGTFAPTSLASSPSFGSPAPSSGYVTNLAALHGVSPNGNWKLYVLDDSFPIGGSISDWMLTLQTGPAFDLSNLGPQTTPENVTKVVTFSLLDESTDPATLVVTAATNGVVSPTNVLNLIASLQVTNNGGANRTLIITPSTNLPSTLTNVDATTTVVLTVTDTNGNSLATSVPVTVSYVNQAPVITTPTNFLALDQNTSITTTFTLLDVDSTLFTSNLVVTSTQSKLIPNSTNGLLVTVSTNTIIPGTTGTVTVKVMPAANESGTNTITVAMTDGTTPVVSTVTVGVKHVYQGPTITGLPATVDTIAGSSTAAIPFTVGSLEVSATSLTVTATSGDEALVPNGGIVLSGSADARSIQLTPLGTASGNDTITLLVGDGKITNSYSFMLKIAAPPSTLFGNGQIALVVGNATNVNSAPYPVTFDVTNLVGSIFNVSLELRGFSNSAPANLDALLVAPDGTTSVMLMSGVAGTTPVNGLDLVFDDSGADLTAVTQLVSGKYHPANVTKRVLPPGAPQSGYGSRLSVFGSMDPTRINGTWRLYLNDLTLGDYGKVSGGFYLTVVTKPAITITTTTPVVIPENSSSNVSFTISDSVTAVSNLVVTASASDNRSLLPLSAVTITGPTPATSGNFVASLTPLQYQNGTANITLTASRADGASSTAVIQVTVPATNYPPIIGRISALTTLENNSTNFQFLVSDVDTALSNLVVTAVSSDQGLIGDTNIVFSGSTNNANVLYGLPSSGVPQASTLTLNLTPNSYRIGSGTITVTVDDNTSNGHNIITSNFTFTVLRQIYTPTIIPPANATVSAGATSIPLGFQVNSFNQPAPTLTVTAVSSDTTIVKNGSIVISPATAASVTNRSLIVTAESGAKGPVTITLTVTDTVNNRSANATFTVNVLKAPIHTYVNNKQILINDNATGSPYPSTIDVQGLSGTLSKLSVTVSNFAHHYPADVGLLLVSPAGQKIVLMNKAGGGTPVTNVVLTFDQAASAAVPQGTTLNSGSFKPADYKPLPYNFFGPAPAGAYGTDLSALTGIVPTGTWSLYVQDDTPPDSGFINGGWSLDITTQPQILGLVNQVIQENATGSQDFTIADDSPSGPSYQFGVSSTNAALIPANGVTFNGSGTNWTVTVKPAANKFGTNLLTVWATNIDNAVTSSSFVVAVQQVIYPPVIAGIPNTNTLAGTAVTVPVSYYDVQVATNQLAVTFQSSNPGLIPVNNISLVGNTAIQVTPAGASSGSSLITVTVSQPANQYGQSATTSFTVTVQPVAGLFGTNQLIAINDRAAGAPYPSTINVSGLEGDIVSASVTVLGLQHSYPSDISMLLVGPQGQKIVLMSRAGSGAGSAITNVNLTFDDAATGAPPQTGLIVSGSYKPSDYNNALVFYAPVTGPYVTNLTTLKGTNPNGTWSLYVQDDLSPDAGQITGGWLLSLITSAPTISFVGPQTTPENVSLTNALTVKSVLTTSDKLTVTAESSDESLAGLVAVRVDGPGTGAASSRSLVIVPGRNLPSAVTNVDGTATITLSVTDGTNSSKLSFSLTVTYVNQAPSFSGLANQSVAANSQLKLAFKANDVDSPASTLVVSATSSPSSLGTLSLASSGNDQTLVFTPTNGVGQATVSVAASDLTTWVTNSFVITITGETPPVFGAIADQISIANAATVVQLPVTDAVTDVTHLTYSGTSDNPALVSKISFAIVGNAVVATVTPLTNALGTAHVTINASDAMTNAATSFLLTVRKPNAMTLGEIDDVSSIGAASVSVPLPVTIGEVALSSLSFTGSGTNSAIVSGVSFAYTGSNEVAIIHLVGNKSGADNITISVTDGFSTDTKSFVLSVEGSIAPPTLTLAVSGNKLVLSFSGTPNAPYAIHGTTDLKTWSELVTITADANGNAAFTNSINATVPVQFFRAQAK
jgi:subtilisin-like proprotein convertase family protein